jgi:hypothetical protein
LLLPAALFGALVAAACSAPNPLYERTVVVDAGRPPHRLDAPVIAERPMMDANPDPVPPGSGADSGPDTGAEPTDGALFPSTIDPADAVTSDGGDIDAELADAAPPDVSARVQPVAHWPMDESTGQKVADATGNGNVGTMKPGASWTTEVFSGARFANPSALKLDGFGGHVTIAVHTLPALAASKTVTAWFWTDGGLSFGRQNIIALVNAGARASIQVGLDLGRVAVWRWSDSGLVVSRGELTRAGWHHVAYVYDGTEHRLYFDGALADSSRLAALGAPVTSATIGSFDGTGEMFQGRLDDVRIYGEPLPASAIKALASGDPDF